jgi:hypothetical protein
MNKENNSSKKWYGCKSTWENIQLRDYAFRNKFKGTAHLFKYLQKKTSLVSDCNYWI